MRRYSLELTQVAEQDIREAYIWYEDQKVKLGQLFKESISTAFKQIQSNPLGFQVRYNEIRVCFLKKFPFGIHYLLKDKSILVIAVFHSSIDSSKWITR